MEDCILRTFEDWKEIYDKMYSLYRDGTIIQHHDSKGKFLSPVVFHKDLSLVKIHSLHVCDYYETGKISEYMEAFPLWEKFTRSDNRFTSLVFEPYPGQFKSFVSTQTDMGFNLWSGYAVDPKPGDWTFLQSFIKDVICAGDIINYRYLMGWLATTFQKPEIPAGVAVILQGASGIGKSMFGKFLAKIWGSNSQTIHNKSNIFGEFNALMRNVAFLFADEVRLVGGGEDGDGQLKGLITEPSFTLTLKGVDSMTVPNCLKILVATNSENFINARNDERRYFVLEVSPKRAGDFAYFDTLSKHLESLEVQAAFLYDLLNFNLSAAGFDIRKPPVTSGLLKQKIDSLSPEHAYIYDALHQGEFLLKDERVRLAVGTKAHDIFDGYLQYCKAQGVRKPKNARSFGMFLGGLFSDLSSFDGYNKKLYDFSIIEVARGLFCSKLGLSPDIFSQCHVDSEALEEIAPGSIQSKVLTMAVEILLEDNEGLIDHREVIEKLLSDDVARGDLIAFADEIKPKLRGLKPLKQIKLIREEVSQPF